MTVAAAAVRAGRRRLAVVAAALLVGALAAWASSRLTWFSATVPTPRGSTDVAVSGAEVLPVPTALAVLALAGIAAAVAVSGLARRVLGVLLVLVALVTVWTVVAAWTSPPDAARLAVLAGTTAAPGASGAVTATAAPVFALVGAVLVVVAGLLLTLREQGMPRMGARYATADPSGAKRSADPDRTAWEELDAGRDPTLDRVDRVDRVDRAPEPRDGPGRGGGERAD
ncbi:MULTISPECIES: Trp biosynthesis-associated membrane protein [Pseudonocardia]|uniref:Trp biosynthesis-associated membrane protein n=1 Tax=Pseudonocardia TaxID=1847 RepID=UPI000CD06152|nr:Trp biosynthesis-associated membrane protein [Pseudonocardia dioxanivorans]GJF06547.1 hypothetical protein PSD17_54940 [Pseudonocardia sp. D17]